MNMKGNTSCLRVVKRNSQREVIKKLFKRIYKAYTHVCVCVCVCTLIQQVNYFLKIHRKTQKKMDKESIESQPNRIVPLSEWMNHIITSRIRKNEKITSLFSSRGFYKRFNLQNNIRLLPLI